MFKILMENLVNFKTFLQNPSHLQKRLLVLHGGSETLLAVVGAVEAVAWFWGGGEKKDWGI